MQQRANKIKHKL